ncbi:MAG TPA: hypothetical protein GXX36_15970 [Clostridiaceae bacterium]|nr:hypothetical protein [Clostridiaceae bacterium]
MNELVLFVRDLNIIPLMLIFTNIILGSLIYEKIRLYFDRPLTEAAGGRSNKVSIYKRCTRFVRQSIAEHRKSRNNHGMDKLWSEKIRLNRSEFYEKAKAKMTRAGYRGKYAAEIYLLLKYLAVPVIFIFAFILNYPDISKSVLASSTTWLIIEMVIRRKRKQINLMLQKNIYKIYKFLHNQISSGVKVTDAIKCVYEIADDRHLREALVKLAARYELTLDIDTSLDELKSFFDVHEIETLCIVLKQGVETGDNQEILARQEDIMFKKYFNYIQAETDSCKVRCVVAAALFVAIIVIMISVPLFIDAANALGKIFTN